MPGELVPIGRRPTLVASFAGPGAASRFAEWRTDSGLADVPPEAVRVEYTGQGAGRAIRVRVDEAYAAGLTGPNEAGAQDGLPPAS